MNTIKHLKDDKIELNGVVYKPYKVCELPPSFGESLEFETDDEKIVKIPLISHWYSYKGYTYIEE